MAIGHLMRRERARMRAEGLETFDEFLARQRNRIKARLAHEPQPENDGLVNTVLAEDNYDFEMRGKA